MRAALAGFEDRLQRCRREAEAFFDERRRDQRCRSELAFLLGQIHAVIEHCRDLEARYRLERVVLSARAWPEESTGARNGRTSVTPRGGARAAQSAGPGGSWPSAGFSAR